MAKIIRPRGDIKTNWAAKNPVLNIREMGIEWEETVGVGKVKLKFGNGISRWNDLDYAVIPDHSAILYNTKPGWETENPILKVSEMGVEWESAIGEGEINLKFGDGITPWNELAYGLVSDITDKKINTITSPPESDVNPVLDAGDTVGEASGKLNRQQGFLKTTLGYDRLDALAATLEGLEHQDFVGILNYLNDRKLNKSDVYNGTDSASEEKAASANAVRIVKELADNNAEGISLLNSNLDAIDAAAKTVQDCINLTADYSDRRYYIGTPIDSPQSESRAMLTVSRFSGATFLQLQPITSAYYYTAFLWNGNSAPTNSDWKRHVTDDDLKGYVRTVSGGTVGLYNIGVAWDTQFKKVYFYTIDNNGKATPWGYCDAILI